MNIPFQDMAFGNYRKSIGAPGSIESRLNIIISNSLLLYVSTGRSDTPGFDDGMHILAKTRIPFNIVFVIKKNVCGRRSVNES